MMKLISKILFYMVAAVLVLWTASLTYAFISTALPNQPVTRYFALVVFDVGMVSWLMIFMFGAEGIAQRGIAFLLSLFDLVGVGMMVYAEIFLGGQTLTAVSGNIGLYALYAVVIWTIINLVGVWAYHYTEPENLKRMKIRGTQDKLLQKSLDKLERKMDAMSDAVSDELSDVMKKDVLHQVGYTGNGKKRQSTSTGTTGGATRKRTTAKK